MDLSELVDHLEMQEIRMIPVTDHSMNDCSSV